MEISGSPKQAVKLAGTLPNSMSLPNRIIIHCGHPAVCYSFVAVLQFSAAVPVAFALALALAFAFQDCKICMDPYSGTL